MAVTSGFFNSSNGDRRYTAEQFSALIDNLITDGVFATVGTAFSVEASGSVINIGVGRAWFNSVWVYNDASLPLAALSAEQLQNRIDAVVIEINHTESVRAGSIKMVRGTPANTPTNPTLVNTESVHQYPLAYIYRPAGQSEVLAEDITNMIGTSACPFVTGILQTINIESLFAQWQGEFDTWFSGLEDMLDGDQATALAARILDLEGQMRDLAMERAVYDVLSDSSDDDIQDSTGAPIEVATRFSETSSGGEIVPATPTADGFKVGDIRETMQTDLGPEWLLCNGDVVTLEDYPVLATFPKTFEGPWALSSDVGCDSFRDNSPIEYLNGYYIHLQRHMSSSLITGVAYSTSPEDTSAWQKNTTMFSNSAITKFLFGIWYVNGYYLISYTEKASSSSAQTYEIAHASSLSGSFTANYVSTGGSPRCMGAVFFNNKYVMLQRSRWNDDYTVAIMVRTALSSNTNQWNTYSVCNDFDNGYTNHQKLYVIDNRLVVLLNYYNINSGYYLYVYYAKQNTIPTGTDGWTVSSILDSANYGSETGRSSGILEHNGVYYVACMRSSSLRLCYTEDITASEWANKVIYENLFDIINESDIYSFVFDGSNFIIVFSRHILTSTSLDGPWLISDVDTQDPAHSDIYGFAYGNGRYLMGTYNDVCYLDQTKRKLPTLSSDGKTYKYIKAKE